MATQAPSPLRIAVMVLFTLSCFALLLYVWLAFGGAIPLQPQGYRFKAAFPSATTLTQEADVRMAGVTIGKVKTEQLDASGDRTLVTMQLERRFAPIPRDTRAVLRQKTLLGETYVELTPGHRSAGMLDEGGRLPDGQIAHAVQIDQIFSAFDKPTREAFQTWMAGTARALHGRGQDLNDVLGDLAPFADDGSSLLRVLDEQRLTVSRLVRNTSVVAGALNERQDALRRLVVNAERTFSATAASDKALAETIRTFPTFLDESRQTLVRLARFSVDTNPLVDELKGPADDLAPTLRDLAALSPDLRALFIDLDPLIAAGERGAPALESVFTGLGPLFDSLNPFLQELDPVLSFLAFNQETVAGFLSNAAANLAHRNGVLPAQTQIALIDARSLQRLDRRPAWERGNAYIVPNAYERSVPMGAIEAFDCNAAGGTVRQPVESPEKAPPCFIAPPSLYNNRKFPFPARGRLGRSRAPRGTEGTRPAVP